MERITYNDTFDGFPMFSPDGKKLVFASNRHDAKQGDTNIFIADWVERAESSRWVAGLFRYRKFKWVLASRRKSND